MGSAYTYHLAIVPRPVGKNENDMRVVSVPGFFLRTGGHHRTSCLYRYYRYISYVATIAAQTT